MTADRRLGLLLLLGATLAWSTSGLFARAIHLDTPTLIMWRALAGAAGLILLLALTRGRQGIGDFARLGRPGWLYAISSGLGMLLFVGALKSTSIAHVAIIYATLPFVAAGLGWLILREAPGRGALIAAIVALAGSAIMVGLGSEGALAGDLMTFGMVLTMAALILISRANPGLPALAAGVVSALLAAAVSLPFATNEGLTLYELTLTAGFGLINSSLAFALFIYGARKVTPVETALMGALEVPVTPLWVWLVFGETPGAATLTGGALVLIAVVGHILWSARQTRQT